MREEHWMFVVWVFVFHFDLSKAFYSVPQPSPVYSLNGRMTRQSMIVHALPVE